jgi:PTH1 family peptidyl-tRNA hydrolase
LFDLIVGLGNVGDKYLNNRHNCGFQFIEYITNYLNLTHIKDSHTGSFFTKLNINNSKVFFLKPNTFMNHSGQTIRKFSNFYKIDPKNILVVHDELDLDIGIIKLKRSGGHAGHNGIKDCISNLGNEFCRLRVGIGRPKFQTVANYVLSDHTKEEYVCLKKVFDFLVSKFDDIFNFEFDELQKVFNGYKLKS